MAAPFRRHRSAAGMNQRRIILILLGFMALLVVGGAGLWLSQKLVQRSEEAFTGYGEVARRNPFHAAERLLTRLGRTVHGVRRLADLPETPPAADTVLVAVPTYVLSAAESQRLLGWANRGGHLIIGVRHDHIPGQGHDHLLNALSARSHRAESASTEPMPVKLDDAMPPLQVRFQSNLRLNDAFWQQARWGQGRVTLLTDIELFANGRLADYDHADFLWALVQQNPGGAIWLQYRLLTPSLAQLLWQHAWMPLTGLLLTLLAALWHYSRRLGPLLVPRSSEQRRLAEHLHASSRFLWRHGAGPALLQAARHYTLRRLERRRPGGAEPLATALDDSDQPLTEHALLHTLQTLQRLNRAP
jgi:hypothetical protein